MSSRTPTNNTSNESAALGVADTGSANQMMIRDGRVGNDYDSDDNSDASVDDDRLEAGVLKDRFGFFVTDKFHKFADVSEEVRAQRKQKETSRTKKWLKMIGKWKKYSGSAKLKARTRKGVPDAVRGFVWYNFAHGDEIRARYPDVRQIDISKLAPVVAEEIERDVDRTFPRHIMFVEENGQGQQSLRRLLRWYASLDTEVGYCQGMGFLAGLFLTYMVEEQAFYTFYSILTRTGSGLRCLYLPKLIETQKILYVFECLGRLHLGDLWQHLENEGIHPTMYFTEWAMTLFCRGFSFELVTRVFDIFLLENHYKIVYRVSLAILKSFEKELKARKFDKIMSFLRDLPNRVDAPKIMDVCWQIPLRRSEIDFYDQQYQDSISSPGTAGR
mmetsp:Transcript_26542/g.28945  ORF Transcript_26542/g.28945 Transcript_26542/m.28945 type:complete len:387 (+) Transcript_26542:70-1230(+)